MSTLRYRCVRCDEWAPSGEGCHDELEEMVQDPARRDDHGLCSECWVTWDLALIALVRAVFFPWAEEV
jgi:hypothetical protein